MSNLTVKVMPLHLGEGIGLAVAAGREADADDDVPAAAGRAVVPVVVKETPRSSTRWTANVPLLPP